MSSNPGSMDLGAAGLAPASHSLGVRITPSANIAGAFHWLRWRQAKNSVRTLFENARLRVVTILVCSAVFWVGLFTLFFEGFQFLSTYVELTNEISEYLFGLFFLSLMVLLLFSNGIIIYTGLFQSREATYLLTTPASSDRIFAHKFIESIVFSSWGFLLLGSPMMAAYGIKVEAPWWFYALFLPMQVAFVLIPGGVGAVAAILVANFIPRRPKVVLGLAVALVVGVAAYSMYQIFHVTREHAPQDWMNQLLERLEFSRNKLLPSRWMAVGVRAAARGETQEAGFYLMVMTSHALLAYLVGSVVARDLYRQGHNRVQGGRSARRRNGLYSFDNVFHKLFWFIPRTIRLLILKDIRSFRRDPAQWSQFLIFFSLLAFYFINIRRLGYQLQSPYWRILVSFLNLAVTALSYRRSRRGSFSPCFRSRGGTFGSWASCPFDEKRFSGASSRLPLASRSWPPRFSLCLAERCCALARRCWLSTWSPWPYCVWASRELASAWGRGCRT